MDLCLVFDHEFRRTCSVNCEALITNTVLISTSQGCNSRRALHKDAWYEEVDVSTITEKAETR